MSAILPEIAVAEHLADRIVAVDAAHMPPAVRAKCEELLIDVVGICLTARHEAYAKAALDGWDDDGPCTAIGHARTLSAAGAAFVNGTAAHAKISTIPSSADRCMPARCWCPPCLPLANATAATAGLRCSASQSASRCCAA